ncbi:MAG: hypothetical protein ABSD74_11780 [Rhizomicrobium sp.]|jgi:hypothetical protein
MAKLVYTAEEILADHPYATLHEEAGYRLHGGFDAKGKYISPRTLHRWPAIRAWADALKAKGGHLVDSSQAILAGGNYPNTAQQHFLLEQGLGKTLWDSLTVTGVIEARGKRLADATAPDFQSIIVEDISQTATGHLNKGLLRAHGLDEGGDDARGLGGHDAMWFAVRDMLFGKDAYPHPDVPESIARPELGRLMPQIPKDHEEWILLLMNVLMIEVRAENFFSFCTSVMRDPSNFRDRREVAMHAADLVDRIRADEAPHVGYLTDAVSELRSFAFKREGGGTVSGMEMIDPIWRGMVQWHGVTNFAHDRELRRENIVHLLEREPNGHALVSRFDELEGRLAA